MTSDERKKRLRIVYSKSGLIRFTSHLDLLRLFFRALTRAGIPVGYSSGFNPHPRVSFAPPLKVGMAARRELLDIHLSEPIPPPEAARNLNRVLPEGISVERAVLLADDSPSLGKTIREADYAVRLSKRGSIDAARLEDFIAAAEVPVMTVRKGEKKQIDARKGVVDLKLEPGRLVMRLSLKENGRPYEVLAGLAGTDPEEIKALFWERLGFSGPGLEGSL